MFFRLFKLNDIMNYNVKLILLLSLFTSIYSTTLAQSSEPLPLIKHLSTHKVHIISPSSNSNNHLALNISFNKPPKTYTVSRSLNSKYFNFPSPNFITIYNSSTNDYSYYKYSKNYSFKSSRNRPYRTYTNIDSFNPYGATTVKEALLLGLFNSILHL